MSGPDPEAPGFGRLLAANLKVLGVALLAAAVAYGIWRGVAALFPEVAWLQG